MFQSNIKVTYTNTTMDQQINQSHNYICPISREDVISFSIKILKSVIAYRHVYLYSYIWESKFLALILILKFLLGIFSLFHDCLFIFFIILLEYKPYLVPSLII